MSFWMERLTKGALISGAFFLWATGEIALADTPEAFSGADVVLLGEVHDNPEHHLNQARILQEIRPKAVVWEMLTPEQARAIRPEWQSEREILERELDWETSGWPAFDLYAPVFSAAAGAAWFGAQVPRSAVPDVMSGGVVGWFGEEAGLFGLSTPLSGEEQSTREAEQQASHCNAMPPEMLPMLVDFQRLRDAVLARAVNAALATAGEGPVVVITGNGHARSDRGVPVYLRKARPDLRIHTLGQSEAGLISGIFDSVTDAPAVVREDPCKAFDKG